MFYNNIVKIAENFNEGNLLKTCIKFMPSYRTICCIFAAFVTKGKGKYSIFF